MIFVLRHWRTGLSGLGRATFVDFWFVADR
jgi:hypothetical protein